MTTSGPAAAPPPRAVLLWAAVLVLLAVALSPVLTRSHVEGFTYFTETMAFLVPDAVRADPLWAMNHRYFYLSRPGVVWAMAPLAHLAPGQAYDLLMWIALPVFLAGLVSFARVWSGARWLSCIAALLALPIAVEVNFFHNDNVLATGLSLWALVLVLGGRASCPGGAGQFHHSDRPRRGPAGDGRGGHGDGRVAPERRCEGLGAACAADPLPGLHLCAHDREILRSARRDGDAADAGAAGRAGHLPLDRRPRAGRAWPVAAVAGGGTVLIHLRAHVPFLPDADVNSAALVLARGADCLRSVLELARFAVRAHGVDVTRPRPATGLRPRSGGGFRITEDDIAALGHRAAQTLRAQDDAAPGSDVHALAEARLAEVVRRLD
jgi:hypothetical protein